ncbi:hypothetical protein HII31_06028 [Pseudocercospora fuligena]|uniref:Uncharacterized protein n=1 Tax=Pseudocercospora fuligena TaxID=685502 RepID=A0A8H6RL56_9PEZI|nr:hypothetical protein HII31_06028 [Pseudocercospora fuligena]
MNSMPDLRGHQDSCRSVEDRSRTSAHCSDWRQRSTTAISSLKNITQANTHARPTGAAQGCHQTDFTRLLHIVYSCKAYSCLAKNCRHSETPWTKRGLITSRQHALQVGGDRMSCTRFTEEFSTSSIYSSENMAIKGGLLRLVMITAYFIAFVCSLLIVGSFAIQTILICCTAGITLLWLLSIIGDSISIILMIAIAGMNRSGRFGCNGNNWRDWDEDTFEFIREIWDDGGVHACRLFVACFAVSLVAIFTFVITIICQVFVRRGRRVKVMKSEGDVLPPHATPA